MKGEIIKYFSRRGFGFIKPENSEEEIFFHVSNYPELVQPEIGKDVEFELIETPKGKEATSITILAETPAEKPAEAESPEVESLDAESPEASVLGVGEIKGVGKATEEKLRSAGFDTVESIASVDAGTVSEKTGMSSKVAAKLVASAKELLE
jgi:cold shock CspA family protein